MPRAAKRFTAHSAPNTRTEERPSAARRGYGRRWARLRRIVLREEPICRTPGCGQPASEIDHIRPRRGGGDDSRENLQALCRRCHARKTAKGL